jgi:protein SCO1/2
MRKSPFLLGGIAAAAFVALSSAVGAQVNRAVDPPDEGRLINSVLPDIEVVTSTGSRLPLSQVASGQPVILGFAFTRCAGVCSPFLRSWRTADSFVSYQAAFHRLVLSFDPRDTPGDMAALARHLGAEQDENWTFAVAAPPDLQRLAAATGFWYDWSEERQQFDHPAMLAAVRNGRLVRLLVGGEISSGRLDELVREAAGEFVASYPLPDRARFRCFQYDPKTGRVSLDWGFALLLVPVGAALTMTATLFIAGGHFR